MRIRAIMFSAVAVCALYFGFAAEKALGPGLSSMKVRVEDGKGNPVAGALLESLDLPTTNTVDQPITDTNGTAAVIVYDNWLFLRVTKDGVTNEVTYFGSNSVARLRRSPTIRLMRSK